MAPLAKFDDANLEAICDILGSTSDGLTGSQIGQYLRECGIPDSDPAMTKRHRLFDSLKAKQISDGAGNCVVQFIGHVMTPVRHVGEREYFEFLRGQLNAVLAFSGLALTEEGQIRNVEIARTLTEAEARASGLRKALTERRVHPDVLTFCRAELLVDNYFHAALEATKSVADKIRRLSGLTSDGSRLVDEAFGRGTLGYPRIAFNRLATESEHDEHTGLMNLIKGVFGAFRNPAAHAPRIHWNMNEQDALDILTTLSLIHRRLDGAIRTHVP
jgi:uncharacterized protein (TIGR02391 family)